MAGSKRLLEDFSWAGGRQNLIVRDGLVVDNTTQGFVSPIGPLRKFAFAITGDTGLFRAHWLHRGRLFVVIEHPYNHPDSPIPPMVGQVEKLDGKTFVMVENLDHVPKPGACVSLLIGYERAIIDEVKLDKMEKERNKVIIWV